jgi:hypothetical protein
MIIIRLSVIKFNSIFKLYYKRKIKAFSVKQLKYIF